MFYYFLFKSGLFHTCKAVLHCNDSINGLSMFYLQSRKRLQYLGSHPGDVVRIWLIAVSVFKRQRGSFSIAEIQLRGGGETQQVL